MNSLTKNPVTTTGGLLGLVMAVIEIAQAWTSGGLATVNWEQLGTAIGLVIVGFAARQSNVTSEKAGAK